MKLSTYGNLIPEDLPEFAAAVIAAYDAEPSPRSMEGEMRLRGRAIDAVIARMAPSDANKILDAVMASQVWNPNRYPASYARWDLVARELRHVGYRVLADFYPYSERQLV